ncbi:hypothetical protein Tco_0474010 [Tanacetum coccineum]
MGIPQRFALHEILVSALSSNAFRSPDTRSEVLAVNAHYRGVAWSRAVQRAWRLVTAMAGLNFADSHNMVAYLEKSTENADFAEIVDFLNANPIRYALTVSPTIYVSCIEQFWSTAKTKTVNNETQIHAKVEGKTIVISESSVRRDLQFDDEDGIACLTNTKIFENLQLMGYEKLSEKLTFYKPYFSPQWKYLIHTILQCLSSKSTAWNEFGTNIASAVICLAKNQKFNFSKLIFDGMMRNLDSSKKFLMYPRFLQLFLNKQIENLLEVNAVYDTPSYTKNIFANKRRQGKYFSRIVTPLFSSMMEQQVDMGEGVLDLETTKTAQAKEIANLKYRESLTGKEKKKKDQIKFNEEIAQRLQAQMQAELEEEERLARQRVEDANIAEWDDVSSF